MQLQNSFSDVDIATLFSDSLSGLNVTENDLRSLETNVDEPAVGTSFCFSQELMEIADFPLNATIADFSNINADIQASAFMFETSSQPVSSRDLSTATETPKVTFAPVLTPTSGPTPVMTPVNSEQSSPCGSYKSGYSSGWGPPSPPHSDTHKKKRGGGRARARKAAAISTAIAYAPISYTQTISTPITSPVTYAQAISTPTTSFALVTSAAMYNGANAAIINAVKPNLHDDSKLPRHKRESHIRAEFKRRNKIQTGLDELKELIPTVADSPKNGSGKESRSALLAKAVEHCRQLRTETKEQAREISKLKLELESLSLCVKGYQKLLPDDGVKIDSNVSPAIGIKDMFKDYVGSLSFGNWKFWIFGILITPLFESFNATVTTTNRASFVASVYDWLEKSCSLISLRPVVFQALRNLSTKTSIMTTPEKLPQEAIDDVMKTYFPVKPELS